MKKYIISIINSFLLLTLLLGCQKYLDVVPDNVATIDNAFAMRAQAEKFLYTCYSYMPRDANGHENPAFSGADEIWRRPNSAGEMWNIARGMQNIVNPFGNGYWNNMFRALRDCNIFLENINRVPDIEESERNRWIAEVKVLKAYYHFYLVRMYGPIPMVKVNLPIDATTEMVRVHRDPVDSCFNYMVQLLDEAAIDNNLPDEIVDPSRYGRITTPIALSLKAKILVTAASPLFNGNTDQAALRNLDGTQLFNQEVSLKKWQDAAEACREAIEISEANGIELYYFQGNVAQGTLSDTIRTQLSIRNSLAQRWNGEVIWANTQSQSDALQLLANIGGLNPAYGDNVSSSQALGPPLKIVEMFYSKNGVPINEDKSWDYAGRYGLKRATEKDKLYVRTSYTTANLHFDREPRFYADLAFDGGVWYGQGRYDDKKPDDLFYLMAKSKQLHGQGDPTFGIVTGYLIKKIIHYQNVEGHVREYSVNPYPWPIIRLADLYLMYAEALNEAEGPVADVFTYVDRVRERAGLLPVAESWNTHSTRPDKYTTINGMREIIQQERMIELAFEGHRFWDLRRWKLAVQTLNAPIRSWDLIQESAEAYYRPKVIWNQTFSNRDYFWPISENNVTVNPNLVQNLGW
ncbi:RagB/SusD family nutrient uptake outer membrane protein [Sphingobacterium pedocola]|uniref:RagB/SusD family nutrient uptake outer membrane protein n=1 Tax=Sphingobacterium pedocola TaxID=2082722 RepID=A0ABR9T7D4_9SPHI|nr:RagB/SusD family nutrient uptake outer membrane protein [Sphingobacterium pedocola]MBE8721235.1 RagB/SusD family nutrient uptake outer membrane protein [Sphingobacterium pedocola]